MYYYVLRGNFMPVHEKASKIAKDSILTITLAGLLVVAYLLILMYTYNSLTQAAENEILKSTSNAATSISRIIDVDHSQVEMLADELNAKYNELNPNRTLDLETIKGEMKDFLKDNKPVDSILISFFFSDATFINSSGETGETKAATPNKLPKNTLSETFLFKNFRSIFKSPFTHNILREFKNQVYMQGLF